jgi:hypothetical protein
MPICIKEELKYRFPDFHEKCCSNNGHILRVSYCVVNVCCDISKECTASTFSMTESGSGRYCSNWEEGTHQLYIPSSHLLQ